MLLLLPSPPSETLPETLPEILPSPPSAPLAKGAIGLEPPLITALLSSALSTSAGSEIDALAAMASSTKSAEFRFNE